MSYLKKAIPEPILYQYRFYRDVKSIWHWSDGDAGRLGFYSEFVSPGDLVFDIGANLGNRTKVFDRIGARVIAVEPQPRCFRVLKTAYALKKTVKIVPSAVGEKPGEAKLFVSDVHEVSSLSPEWMERVKTTSRFGNATWSQTITVPVITLEELIRRYGQPRFVKIDVEGFEYQALKGLTAPVAALSFEFTPETSATALSCVAYLDRLGMNEFNLVLGESTQLSSKTWLTASETEEIIRRYENNTSMFGDIYARRSGSNGSAR